VFLEVERLTKSFGGLTAVFDLSFGLEEGEIVGLMGPNGSGKTTLFSLITGFLKPDTGEVRFKGKGITGLKPHKVCENGIMRTFQLVKPFTNMIAVENVMVGRVYGRNPAVSLNKAEKESREILEFVGLGDKCDIVAGNLTLPDRKRLEVARALAGRPHLLLLDEIMAGLNPVEVEAAVQLVRNINKSGVTIFMIEHIVKVLMGISRKVIVINVGAKIAEGPPKEIVKNKKVVEAYLGKKGHA
jgi:branched-chain amino acid transport system ATP-binding protein